MKVTLYLYLLLAAITKLSEASTTIILDNGCGEFGSETFQVTETDLFFLQWNGRNIPSECSISFTADSEANSYSICVKPVNFNITDCNVQVSFGDILDGIFPDRILGCNDVNPTTFCTAYGNNLYVDLYRQTIMPFEPGAGSFKLKVTAKAKHKKAIFIGLIAGGGLSAIIVISIVVYFIFKYKQSTLSSSNAATTPSVQTTTTVSRRVRTQGYSNPNYPR